MAVLLVTFNDLEGHFAVRNHLNSHTSRNIAWIITICLHMNRKAHEACNFNYLFENEGRQGSHVHCKCGNVSEIVPDGVVVITDN